MCVCVCVCVCVSVCVCVCVSHSPICSVQELNECKRSMGEVVVMSTQAYDARQVAAQEHNNSKHRRRLQ